MLCHRWEPFGLCPYLSPLSLCVAYIILLRTRIHINTRAGLAERQANQPMFPFRLCVHFQATAAPLISFRLRLCFFVTLARPTRSRLSPLATAIREPVCSTQLTISSPSRLDCRPITHAYGSGNNKPRTLLPFTLACVLPSGTSHGFIFILRTLELSCGLTLCYTVLSRKELESNNNPSATATSKRMS